MSTTLYRAYNAKEELLYVGISNNFMSRMQQHWAKSKWHKMAVNVTLEHFELRKDAETAEVKAIQEEKPLFNKKDNEDWHNSSTHLVNLLRYDDTHHIALREAHNCIIDALQAYDLGVDLLPMSCYAFQSAIQVLCDDGSEDLEIPCVSCEKLYYSDLMEEKAIEVSVADSHGSRTGLWGRNEIWEATVRAVTNER